MAEDRDLGCFTLVAAALAIGAITTSIDKIAAAIRDQAKACAPEAGKDPLGEAAKK